MLKTAFFFTRGPFFKIPGWTTFGAVQEMLPSLKVEYLGVQEVPSGYD
jgi:hypothetical protein